MYKGYLKSFVPIKKVFSNTEFFFCHIITKITFYETTLSVVHVYLKKYVYFLKIHITQIKAANKNDLWYRRSKSDVTRTAAHHLALF